MRARLLWLLLAVQRSQAQHHQVYSNVFFNHQPQTGRPSTSFVMVKSEDGRSYQLSNSGVDFTFSSSPLQEVSSNSVSLTLSQCPEVGPKPSQMCLNKTPSCWSEGQSDVDCPGYGLCCYDGCVASCLQPGPTSQVSQQASQCPPVEDKLPGQCSNATANCWSRGVADVDCPDFGLCCYDGCVNTCLSDTLQQEEDLEYDLSLAEGLEEEDEEEEDEDLADELDDQLADYDDSLDGYGAPQAAPLTYLADIDTYGSPLAPVAGPGPVQAYKDILENDLRTQQVGIGSKKEHSSPIVTRNGIAGVGPSFFQSGLGGRGNLVKPKKSKISQVKKSGRNPYKTQTAFSSFKYANGIDNNNKVKQYQSHKTKFRSSKQFQPIFFRGGKAGATTIKRTESPVKNIVRKKLQLTEKPRGPDVMSTLEKILKKHFSIFSYF